MANVIRGRSFAPSSVVTADGLNQLVRNAQIENLTLADFAGANIQWVSAHTAPTDAGPGWVTAHYEGINTFFASGPTAAELSYFLRIYASGVSHGNACLFSPYRIETRRGAVRVLVANDCPAGAVRCSDSPAPAAAWRMCSDRGQTQQKRRVLGAAMETGASAASSPDIGGHPYPRTTLWGIAPGRFDTVNWDTTTWADARFCSVATDGTWKARGGVSATHITQAGFFHGYAMRNSRHTSVQVQPAFLFGGFILVVQ